MNNLIIYENERYDKSEIKNYLKGVKSILNSIQEYDIFERHLIPSVSYDLFTKCIEELFTFIDDKKKQDYVMLALLALGVDLSKFKYK